MKVKASQYHNEDPIYYKYRELVVGLFVLIPILLIPIVLAAIVIRSDWARERFELNFTHKLNIQLNEGNEVYILSKRVGLVRSVQLDPEGFVAVKLRIDEQYRKLIRSNSKIRVKQKNMFVGDWQVEIEIGGLGYSMIEDGDTLDLVPPLNLQEMSDQVISITSTVNEILDTIAHGDGLISRLLKSDTTLNNRASETFASIRTGLKSMNEALDQGNAILKSGSNVMDSVIAVRTPKLFDDVEMLIARTDSAVIELTALVNAADTVPPEVIRSLALLNEDLDETKILVKSAQRLRILRKKVADVKAEK